MNSNNYWTQTLNHYPHSGNNSTLSSTSSFHSNATPLNQTSLSQASFLSASTIPPDESFNFDQLVRDAQNCERVLNHQRPQNSTIYGVQQYSGPQQPASINPYQMQPNIHTSFVHPHQLHQPFNVPLSMHQQMYSNSSSSMNSSTCEQENKDPNCSKESPIGSKKEGSPRIPTKNMRISKEFKLPRRRDSKISTENIKKEVEEKFHTECTFKPQITKYTGSKRELSAEERWKRLADSKRTAYQNREKEKQRLEQEEMKQYSFQPNAQKKNTTVVRSSSVVDRLSKKGVDKVAQREQAKREMEMAQMNQHNYAPKINQNVPENYVPVFDRVAELQKKKEEKLRELRIQQFYGNKELTFNPEINKTSEQIAKTKNGLHFHEKVQMGLLNEATGKPPSQSEEIKECTFQPKVNPKSEEMLKFSRLYSKETDFVKRQEILVQREQQRKELLREKEDSTNQYTFKPSINKTSQIIAEAKSSRSLETEEDRIQRLSQKDMMKKQALQSIIQDQYYSQFTFQPEVNENSKMMAPSSSSVTDYKLHEDIKKHKLDMLKKDKYDFKPTLIAKPLNVQPKVLDANYEEFKNRKLEYAQQVQEYNEIKDCTFKPQVNKSIPEKDHGPIVIKGLGQFLDRKDRAKRIEEEKREAEEAAFRPRYRIDQSMNNTGYTIPEPFQSLHPGNSETFQEVRRRELINRVRQEEMQNCTFHPRTNASSVDVGIESFLADL